MNNDHSLLHRLTGRARVMGIALRGVAQATLHGTLSEGSVAIIKPAVPPTSQIGGVNEVTFSEQDIVELKKKFGYPFKLNLGCGDGGHVSDDFIHIDIRDTAITDIVSGVGLLDFPPESCEVIFAWNVLEHISWRQTDPTLSHWLSLLQPDGILVMSIPNLEKLSIDILNANSVIYTDRSDRGGNIMEHLYGGQDYDGNYHFAGWKPDWLASKLKDIGFEVRFIGDGNVKDFGLPFERKAGLLGGANGWDMMAVAVKPGG
jgi:hypothetical protein